MAKKFFASLLVLISCMFSCSAYADLVYTTDNGVMGLIKMSKTSTNTLSADAPVQEYSGAAHDAIAVQYYDEDGNSFIALIEPETDKSISSGDTALIFNASDLTKPSTDEPKTLTGVYNTKSAAYSDNHRGIFFASGVDGEAKITQFDTNNLEFVRSFSYLSSNDNAEMSTVLVNGSSVFGLINQATSQDSLLLRFDGQINSKVKGYSETKAEYNSELMTFGDNNRIFLAHSGGVDGLSNGEFKLITSTDSPVKALCRDSSNGFYFITQSDDSGIQVLKHYKTGSSVNEINEVDSVISESLICKAVYYDKDNNKFIAVIIGDCIAVYDTETDELIDEFTSSQLGGRPLSITYIAQNTSIKSSSKSSGCDITGAGILLILSASYMIIHMKRKEN